MEGIVRLQCERYCQVAVWKILLSGCSVDGIFVWLQCARYYCLVAVWKVLSGCVKSIVRLQCERCYYLVAVWKVLSGCIVEGIVTPFSLIQPLFICLTFSVSTLHQDSSTPLLTQELYAFRTLTKTFGHRSFSHATPSVWNSLPHEIRHIQSTTAFKVALKTHLFKSYLY